MSRRYGKTSKPDRAGKDKRKGDKSGDGKPGSIVFKLRGRDGAPLSMSELIQGLFQLARELKAYDGQYRARHGASVYITLVDENGDPAPVPSGERKIYPYKSAASENGL